MDVEELARLGRRRGACPYYAARAALPEADLVLLPYAALLAQARAPRRARPLGGPRQVWVQEACAARGKHLSQQSGPARARLLEGSQQVLRERRMRGKRSRACGSAGVPR
jgi:hypothetical protein